MTIAIELPPEVTRRLESEWGDLSRHTLELLALQAYKDELLTAAQMRRLLGFKTRLEVDGCISPATTPAVVAHGAQVLVAGNAVFKEKDYATAITDLRRAAERAEKR